MGEFGGGQGDSGVYTLGIPGVGDERFSARVGDGIPVRPSSLEQEAGIIDVLHRVVLPKIDGCLGCPAQHLHQVD